MLFVPRASPVIRQGGQGLVEYAVIIVLVALVVVIGLTSFGQLVLSLYEHVIDSWPGIANGNNGETVQMIRYMVYLL